MTIFFCAPDRWFVRKKMHSIKADDLNYCLVQTALGYQLGYNIAFSRPVQERLEILWKQSGSGMAKAVTTIGWWQEAVDRDVRD
jgi:hypothetical protein